MACRKPTATREFAKRHRGRVFLNFFVESERGAVNFDRDTQTVKVNRTEALDASRAAIREKKISLPRRLPIVEEFAKHMACDAKVLEEDPDTGAKKYRYVKTGTRSLLASLHLRLDGGKSRLRRPPHSGDQYPQGNAISLRRDLPAVAAAQGRVWLVAVIQTGRRTGLGESGSHVIL